MNIIKLIIAGLVAVFSFTLIWIAAGAETLFRGKAVLNEIE